VPTTPVAAERVIEPGLPHRRDDDPIAGQVDGVAVALIHGGHFPASVGPFQRVLRPFSLNGDGESRAVGAEFAEHGIGDFAVHLDVFLAGERIAARLSTARV
jgi:hypothetical protein